MYTITYWKIQLKKYCVWIICLYSVLEAKAQNKTIIDKSMLQQKEFYIPELKCVQGKKLIESFLLRNEGITEITTNLTNHTVKVSYVKFLTTPETIAVAISNTGYAVDSFSANEDARKKLPICCLDTFTNATVKMYEEKQKEEYRLLKKRYREPKKFMCCKGCDLVAKYRNLVR